jgi:mono/diheme cytochrome c family protein
MLLRGALLLVVAAAAMAVVRLESPDEPGHHADATPAGTGGQQLFVAVGCAHCHGDRAEGGSMAPAIRGITSSEVQRQVRMPAGIMPPFSAAVISDTELRRIAGYVASLARPRSGARSALREELVSLHEDAHRALIDGASADASVALGELEGLTEGAHLRRVEEAAAALAAGELERALRIEAELLSGVP